MFDGEGGIMVHGKFSDVPRATQLGRYVSKSIQFAILEVIIYDNLV